MICTYLRYDEVHGPVQTPKKKKKNLKLGANIYFSCKSSQEIFFRKIYCVIVDRWMREKKKGSRGAMGEEFGGVEKKEGEGGVSSRREKMVILKDSGLLPS